MVRSHPFTLPAGILLGLIKMINFPSKRNIMVENTRFMFWGSISTMGRGALIVVQGTMDGRKYKKILREDLLPEAAKP
jgi:hypothetical protein